MIERCTDLPTSVVSRDTCAYFDLINKIRTEPISFVKTLEDRKKEIEAGDSVHMVSAP